MRDECGWIRARLCGHLPDGAAGGGMLRVGGPNDGGHTGRSRPAGAHGGRTRRRAVPDRRPRGPRRGRHRDHRPGRAPRGVGLGRRAGHGGPLVGGRARRPEPLPGARLGRRRPRRDVRRDHRPGRRGRPDLYFDDDGDGTQEAGEDGRSVLAASPGPSMWTSTPPRATRPTWWGRRREDRVGRIHGRDARSSRSRSPTTRSTRTTPRRPTPVSTWSSSITLASRMPRGEPASRTARSGWAPRRRRGPKLPWDDVVGSGHPELPSDLTGLVAFVSWHEGSRRIYTFDPGAGAVRRVTDGTRVGGQRLAIARPHAHRLPRSAGRTAYGSYEIYTVNVDGSGLKKLTDNEILDGHPGWSPDDDRLVYASFRGDGRAKLVLMTPEGEEIAVLTPDGVDDNDPDFLPDGRIVFKTDRFSSSAGAAGHHGRRRHRRARAHHATGVSDHDPVGDGAHAWFERFPRPTSYATDPEAGFVGWDLVEVGLDGTGERTMLSDGWINWLPVPTRPDATSPFSRASATRTSSSWTPTAASSAGCCRTSPDCTTWMEGGPPDGLSGRTRPCSRSRPTSVRTCPAAPARSGAPPPRFPGVALAEDGSSIATSPASHRATTRSPARKVGCRSTSSRAPASSSHSARAMRTIRPDRRPAVSSSAVIVVVSGWARREPPARCGRRGARGSAAWEGCRLPTRASALPLPSTTPAGADAGREYPSAAPGFTV